MYSPHAALSNKQAEVNFEVIFPSREQNGRTKSYPPASYELFYVHTVS